MPLVDYIAKAVQMAKEKKIKLNLANKEFSFAIDSEYQKKYATRKLWEAVENAKKTK